MRQRADDEREVTNREHFRRREMKLEIELFRYREVLFGRVLHMDEDLRGRFVIANDEFAIDSVRSPALVLDTLFVRGTERDKDKRPFSYRFSSEEGAIAAAKNIQSLLQELNNPAQEGMPSPIEQLI